MVVSEIASDIALFEEMMKIIEIFYHGYDALMCLNIASRNGVTAQLALLYFQGFSMKAYAGIYSAGEMRRRISLLCCLLT